MEGYKSNWKLEKSWKRSNRFWWNQVNNFGKGVKAKGEVSNNNQIYNNQIAPLVRKLMNLPQKFGSGYGKPMSLEYCSSILS